MCTRVCCEKEEDEEEALHQRIAPQGSELCAVQAAYLQLVPSTQLATLFKSSLTPSVLLGIARTALTALATAGAQAPAGCMAAQAVLGLDARHAAALLRALPSVPRFGMVLMCLTRTDREDLRQQWDSLGGEAAAVLEGVRSQFSL